MNNSISKPHLIKQSEIFKALGHPTRLKMVYALSEGDLCVCDLQKLIGDSLPTVSRHLSVLKQAGIVDSHKDGLRIIYSLNFPCITTLLNCMMWGLKSGPLGLLKKDENAQRVVS